MLLWDEARTTKAEAEPIKGQKTDWRPLVAAMRKIRQATELREPIGEEDQEAMRA